MAAGDITASVNKGLANERSTFLDVYVYGVRGSLQVAFCA